MTFDLPMPPSANNLFATYNGRRIISREYKAWKLVAADKLGAQYAAYGSPAVHKPVALHIRLNINYRSDICNREKALTDLLVANLDMPDDCWIERVVIERDRTVDAAVVTVASGDDDARSIGEIIKPIMKRLSERVEP